MSRPVPVWLIEVWVEAELAAHRFVSGSREHADIVGEQLLDAERVNSGRVGNWEVDVKLALREKADVYWNDRAPAGWVEIQREDSSGELPDTFGDAEAAQTVCRAAGVPESCAMWCEPGAASEDDGGAVVYSGTPDTFYATTVVATTVAIPAGCFAVVPAVVAWLAHLIDDEQLAQANGGPT